jgi:calcineurin-like phosphoesterase family protein
MKKLLIITLLLLPLQSFASLDYVTDLHAGGNKQRNNGKGNIVYPKKANLKFKQFLKNSSADAVVVLGDSLNKHEKKYAKKLKVTAKRSGKRIIWVKGNHDGEAFKVLCPYNYYITQIKDQIIITLDTTSTGNSITGGIDPIQMQWFKSVYSPNAIIVMHHPPVSKEGTIHPQYQEFMAIAGKNEIHAGHWHKDAKFGNIKVHYPLTSKKPLSNQISH